MSRTHTHPLAALAAAALTATLVAAPSQAADQAAKLTLSDNLTKVGDRVVATSRFSPVRKGRPVVLQQLQGSTWVTIATGAQSSKGGTRFTLPTIAGSRSYRAVTLAQGSLATRKTATKKLRVKAPGTVKVTPGLRDGNPLEQSMSGDGRYVVYVPAPTGDPTLTYIPQIWDRSTGQRRPITSTGVTVKGNIDEHIRISTDGSTVVSRDQTYPKVWAWDRATGAYTEAPGTRGPAPTGAVVQGKPEVSANGRFVAYVQSTVVGDKRTRDSVIVWDRSTNTTREIYGVAVDGAANPTGAPIGLETRISGDGQWVAIDTALGSAQLWHATDGTTTPLPTGVDNISDLSDDARFVVFDTYLGTVGQVLDRATGAVTKVRLAGDYKAWNVAEVTDITANGRWLVVTGTRRDTKAVFLVGRSSGRTIRASLTWKGGLPDRDAFAGSASEDGRFVAFISKATNISAVKDVYRTFPTFDVYVRDRG